MSEPFTSMHTCTLSSFACVNTQSKKVLYLIHHVFLLFPFSVLWEVYKQPQTCNFSDCEHAPLSCPQTVLCIGVLGIIRGMGMEKGFIFLLPMSSNSLFYNISSDTCVLSQTSFVLRYLKQQSVDNSCISGAVSLCPLVLAEHLWFFCFFMVRETRRFGFSTVCCIIQNIQVDAEKKHIKVVQYESLVLWAQILTPSLSPN